VDREIRRECNFAKDVKSRDRQYEKHGRIMMGALQRAPPARPSPDTRESRDSPLRTVMWFIAATLLRTIGYMTFGAAIIGQSLFGHHVNSRGDVLAMRVEVFAEDCTASRSFHLRCARPGSPRAHANARSIALMRAPSSSPSCSRKE